LKAGQTLGAVWIYQLNAAPWKSMQANCVEGTKMHLGSYSTGRKNKTEKLDGLDKSGGIRFTSPSIHTFSRGACDIGAVVHVIRYNVNNPLGLLLDAKRPRNNQKSRVPIYGESGCG
jgi:hypothetical protein